MEIKLVNVGFGSIVAASRIIAVVHPDSAPIKRMIQEARRRFMLIDATHGRRTRAVIVTDSDHVILSAVQPMTVAHRLYVLEHGEEKSLVHTMDDVDREALEATYALEDNEDWEQDAPEGDV